MPPQGCSGGSKPDERKVTLIEFMIVALTAVWLLSFFGLSILPGLPHTGGFIYVLSVLIVVLIFSRFFF